MSDSTTDRDARQTGRTEAMLRTALANDGTGPTCIVAATHADAMRLAIRFRELAGDAATRPMPDTVDIQGRRVYFMAVDQVERGSVRGMFPGPRYIDHYAKDWIVRLWMATNGVTR